MSLKKEQRKVYTIPPSFFLSVYTILLFVKKYNKKAPFKKC